MMIKKQHKPKKSGDILEALPKRIRKALSRRQRIAKVEEKRRKRMSNAREWSMRHGNGKIPTWTVVNWSTTRAPVMIQRAIWMVKNVPTRVRTKTLKSGKKRYYLDLYNHTARKLGKGKKR